MFTATLNDAPRIGLSPEAEPQTADDLRVEAVAALLNAAPVAPTLPSPKSDGAPVFRFATSEDAAVQTSAPAQPRQAVTTRRRRARLDWEAIAVILLMLTCLAVGLYRLIWMGQI